MQWAGDTGIWLRVSFIFFAYFGVSFFISLLLGLGISLSNECSTSTLPSFGGCITMIIGVHTSQLGS